MKIKSYLLLALLVNLLFWAPTAFAQNGNFFSGIYAGYSNTTGSFNAFAGYGAGYSNTTGFYNTALGFYAGSNNATTSKNTSIGTYAGYSTSSGYGENVFVGFQSGMYSSSGFYNTFMGSNSGYNNYSGSYNTFMGTSAGYNNTTGISNTFVGYSAGSANTTSSSNSFFGNLSGYRVTNGGKNSFFGSGSGNNSTTGFENSFIGVSAGTSNTTGSKNTSLGYLAGPSTGTLSNATAIGHRARVTASNSLVLGSINGTNGATADTKVGIRTTAPSYNLHVNGSAGKPGGGSWTAASDKRLKQNIRDFNEGLEIVEKIRPVSFQYNGKAGMPTDKEFVGIIAQEMQQIAPYTVGEFTYQDSTGSQEKYLDYDATALTYILVNAVKEQQEQISALKKELAAVKEQLGKQMPEAGNPQARIWQNTPNPYSQTTTIKYELPASAGNAFIKVYSTTGQELKSFNLTGRTAGEVTLSAGILSAGTYVYTLYVDGVSIDSKKLVLTK